MPIYEYRCDSCGQEFEYLVFVETEEPKRCQFCDETTINRLMSACTSITKDNGSGDYVDSGSSSPSCGACTASNCTGCK